MEDSELFDDDFFEKIRAMSQEDRKKALDRREEFEKQFFDDERRRQGQGLRGKYAVIYFFGDDGVTHIYQAMDWEIIGDWLSCITFEMIIGEPYTREIIPTSRIYQITSFEEHQDFKDIAKRAIEVHVAKRERQREKASDIASQSKAHSKPEYEDGIKEQVRKLKAKGYMPDEITRMLRKRGTRQ